MPALLSKFVSYLAGRPMQAVQADARHYDAAQRTRMNGDWLDSRMTADKELHDALEVLRSCSREAERNNGLYRRMLNMHQNYVCGVKGFQLQSIPVNPDGKMDAIASNEIEKRFRSWGRTKVTLDGRKTLLGLSKSAVRHMVRDGELFIRKVIRNGELYLQPLEADFVPINIDDGLGITSSAGKGTRTINGIVVDGDGKRVAYHVARVHPGGQGYGTSLRPETDLVPADQIIHLYSPEREGQMRGAPIGASSFNDLRMLKGYFTAELAAARINAARPVTIERMPEAEEEFTGDEDDEEEEPITFNGGPAGVTVLPVGYKASYNPAQHPAGNFAPYVDKVTQHLAAAWGVSHALLTRNLSQVNFSSMQIESQDCDRYFADMQQLFADLFLCDVFHSWLEIELLKGIPVGGKGNLRPDKLEKFQACYFIPPPFPSYDKKTALEVAKEKVKMGIRSLSDVCLEIEGEELQDILPRLKLDKDLLESMELDDVWDLLFPPAETKQQFAKDGELGEGEVEAEPVEAEKVADTALNGGQVTSLVEVCVKVSEGVLPKPSAIVVLQSAFNLSPEDAGAIINPIEIKGPPAPRVPFGGDPIDDAPEDTKPKPPAEDEGEAE